MPARQHFLTSELCSTERNAPVVQKLFCKSGANISEVSCKPGAPFSCNIDTCCIIFLQNTAKHLYNLYGNQNSDKNPIYDNPLSPAINQTSQGINGRARYERQTFPRKAARLRTRISHFNVQKNRRIFINGQHNGKPAKA